MFKITLQYESDINGIYTQEIETADDLFNAERKRDRMLSRWLNIISNYLLIRSIEIYQINSSPNDQNYSLQYEIIQLFIKYLNLRDKKDRDRTFSIKIEEL